MQCRKTNTNEIDTIMGLIKQAKRYLREIGVDQWQNDYPDINDIIEDIRAENGYVLTDENIIVGYACISFEEEPAYNCIQGQWLSIQPYAVIHRMAIDNSFKGKGLASEFFKFTEKMCTDKNIYSIKIDTNNDNKAMQHILAKNGFTYCGTINFDNSEKIAYEKII